MYQRAKILQAFEKAGLTKSQKKMVRQFMLFLEDNPAICWKDAALEFKNNFSDILADIVPAILATGDPLIISNLLKHLDLSNKKEVQNVKSYLKKINPHQNPRLFMHLARHYADEFGDDLAGIENLPAKIRFHIEIQASRKLVSKAEPQKGKIEIFPGKDGQYYFHLISDAGEILLVSEAYKSKATCKNGVKSVKHNATDKNNYEAKTSKDNQHYFVLVAANKKIIGTGKMYASATLRDQSIKAVQKMIPEASVVRLVKSVS